MSHVASVLTAVSLLACTIAMPAAAQPAIQEIPFETWLAAQSADYFGFIARSGPQVDPPVFGNAAFFEGFGANALGHYYGMSVAGSVTKRDLPDGRAEIHVNVQFSNAITVGLGPGVQGVIFGYDPSELSIPILTPALSSGHIELRYVTASSASPTLDLAGAIHGSVVNKIEHLAFSSNGTGPLRAAFGVSEGTPGRCVVIQTALIESPGGGATVDGFPAERVVIRVAGSGQGSRGVSASPEATSASPLLAPATPQSSMTWGQLKMRYRGVRRAATE